MPGPRAGAILALLALSCATGARATNSAYDVAAQWGDTELLHYPPRPLPETSCACRVTMKKRAVLRSGCPTPWESKANTSLVPPALELVDGTLVESSSSKPARLQGVNWFGWETGTPNFDGLWAWNDAELPENTTVSLASLRSLGVNFFGKRTMTNDFAHVVHRMKLLGFNAVRVPMNFTNLQRDIPPPSSDGTEFYPCIRDPLDYININQTLDPLVWDAWRSRRVASAAAHVKLVTSLAPQYTGMQHPPPAVPSANGPRCGGKSWTAPFLPAYTPAPQYGRQLQLTLCNWYLPQGPGVQAIHRFLWQVRYLVAQGFYVVLAQASYRDVDPNMVDASLFASNWGNLWHMLTELPEYNQLLKGRVFPDLANEPSRWGCQWERPCVDSQGRLTCAPGAELYTRAMLAIHNWDPDVAVFANALGQANVDPGRFPTCSAKYEGMPYGDGTITDGDVIREHGISDASHFLEYLPALSHGKVILAPHVYPGTLTGLGEASMAPDALFKRLDLSFGLKAIGRDATSDRLPLARMPVVLGEFGVRDHGTSADGQGGDFTNIQDRDKVWLADLARYLRGLEAKGSAPVSWFVWSWNANSGDTKGLIGPDSTWKSVQWTKIRLLSQFGLRPWYCVFPVATAAGLCGPPPAANVGSVNGADAANGLKLVGEHTRLSSGRRM